MFIHKAYARRARSCQFGDLHLDSTKITDDTEHFHQNTEYFADSGTPPTGGSERSDHSARAPSARLNNKGNLRTLLVLASVL